MNFRWESPDAFSMLLWILGLTLLMFWRLSKNQSHFKKIFSRKISDVLLSSFSIPKSRLRIVLRFLAFGFAVVALARPQFGESTQQIKSEGVELILALDVSESMMAEDIKPNRLEHARNEVNRLLDQLSGDKVGLIAFAGTAALVSPLTNDFSTIRSFLETANPISVSTQGTNFKSAIDMSMSAFKRGGLDPDEGVRVTKVLLFVTDGEQTTGEALAAARDALSKGMRIFTLGVGTKAGAPIPDRDQFGNLTGYKKDRSGQTVLSTANEEKLSELAREGGGAYYHADFSGQAVQSLKRDLDRMERAEFESSQMVNYDERFQIPLLIGILLFMLDLLLGERARSGSRWKGRFVTILPFLLIFTSPWVEASSIGGILRNKAALKAAEEQKMIEANRELADAIVENPEMSELHYNLGKTFEANQENEKAAQSFEQAARLTGDAELRFQSHFNAGKAFEAQKKIDEAINEYQSALYLKPDSVEVKTNIELLLAKGGGGGQGGEQQQKSSGQGDKDGKGQEESEKEKNQEQKPGAGQQAQEKKRQPRPFQSQELSQQEVKSILDELRRQEEQVRAKFNDKKVKEIPVEKDW